MNLFRVGWNMYEVTIYNYITTILYIYIYSFFIVLLDALLLCWRNRDWIPLTATYDDHLTHGART